MGWLDAHRLSALEEHGRVWPTDDRSRRFVVDRLLSSFVAARKGGLAQVASKCRLGGAESEPNPGSIRSLTEAMGGAPDHTAILIDGGHHGPPHCLPRRFIATHLTMNGDVHIFGVLG